MQQISVCSEKVCTNWFERLTKKDVPFHVVNFCSIFQRFSAERINTWRTMFRRVQWSDVLAVIFAYRNLQSFTYKISLKLKMVSLWLIYECSWNGVLMPQCSGVIHSNWIWASFGRKSLAAWRLDNIFFCSVDLCCSECRGLWYNLQSKIDMVSLLVVLPMLLCRCFPWFVCSIWRVKNCNRLILELLGNFSFILHAILSDCSFI